MLRKKKTIVAFRLTDSSHDWRGPCPGLRSCALNHWGIKVCKLEAIADRASKLIDKRFYNSLSECRGELMRGKVAEIQRKSKEHVRFDWTESFNWRAKKDVF